MKMPLKYLGSVEVQYKLMMVHVPDSSIIVSGFLNQLKEYYQEIHSQNNSANTSLQFNEEKIW